MGMELTNNNKLSLEPDLSNMSDPNVVKERWTTNGDRTADFTDLPLWTYSRRDQSRSKYKSEKRRRRRSYSTPLPLNLHLHLLRNRKSKDLAILTKKVKKIYTSCF